MDNKDLLKIARDCQAQAYWLAPLQNAVAVTAGRRATWAHRVWRYFFPAPPATIPTDRVTLIVNALLNAGNSLEFLLRPQPQPPEPDVPARQHPQPG